MEIIERKPLLIDPCPPYLKKRCAGNRQRAEGLCNNQAFQEEIKKFREAYSRSNVEGFFTNRSDIYFTEEELISFLLRKKGEGWTQKFLLDLELILKRFHLDRDWFWFLFRTIYGAPDGSTTSFPELRDPPITGVPEVYVVKAPLSCHPKILVDVTTSTQRDLTANWKALKSLQHQYQTKGLKSSLVYFAWQIYELRKKGKSWGQIGIILEIPKQQVRNLYMWFEKNKDNIKFSEPEQFKLQRKIVQLLMQLEQG